MKTAEDFVGRTGEVVGDRYELLELLGSGGQSVVYKALDYRDGDHVAIKICAGADPDAGERMFREAFVMAQLQNTAAVRVLHHTKTYDGAFALVMELLEGSDLQSVLHMREGRGTKATHLWLTTMLEPIVDTLEAAHAQGIVHRDLKAENVFVLNPSPSRLGSDIRLLDFGFAKLQRMPRITAMDAAVGSPSYVAPEVWKDGAWRATPQVDIYALGVLVFRILAGKMPFEGNMIQIARLVLGARRPSLHQLRPDLPPEVDSWIDQVLAVEPLDRFARITAAWRALEGCLEGVA
jgi:serine/threonine-protein kinase